MIQERVKENHPCCLCGQALTDMCHYLLYKFLMLKNNSEVKAANESTLEIEGMTDHEMGVEILNDT